MKKILFKTSLALAVLLLSCNKPLNSTTIETNTSLVGKWILIETLADPGDGSGKWQLTNTPNDYIYFKADSSISTNAITNRGGLIRYRLPSESTISLIYANGDSFINHFKIDGDILTFSGGCYEARGSKFKKVIF